MLLSGRPDLFWDRIDKGDAKFLDVRDAPWGKVDYMLISRWARDDLLAVRYPRVRTNTEPGLKLVYQTERWLLLSVAYHTPARGPFVRH